MMRIDHTFDGLDNALLGAISENESGWEFGYLFRDAGVHGEATRVAKWPTLTWTVKIVEQRIKALVKAKKIQFNVAIRTWSIKR